MELIAFHKMRTAVQSNASPASPDAVALLERDVQAALSATGLFEDVEVGSTDDVDNLVIAMCTFPSQLTESQVAQRLEQVWQDRLRYQFWEAHTTLVDEDQVELEAATRTGSDGHYVTIHIVAQKAAIPAQRSYA